MPAQSVVPEDPTQTFYGTLRSPRIAAGSAMKPKEEPQRVPGGSAVMEEAQQTEAQMVPSDPEELARSVENGMRLWLGSLKTGSGQPVLIETDQVSFDLDKELGKGAFGVVYQGQYLRDFDAAPETAAMKVFKGLVCGNKQHKVKKEVEILCKLPESPHLIGFHGVAVWRKGPKLYTGIVMELADGCLTNLIERKASTVTICEALRMGREMVHSLMWLHREGFVHRDIKTDNVLMAGGKLKLADFGLTEALRKVNGQWVGSAERVGTDAYRSPQTYCGEAFQTVDDVWCLMIVMLELTLQYLCMDRNAIDKINELARSVQPNQRSDSASQAPVDTHVRWCLHHLNWRSDLVEGIPNEQQRRVWVYVYAKALSMGLSVDTLSRAQAADLDRPLSLVLACLKNEKAMTTLCASADVPREEPYDSLRGQEWLQAMNTLAKKLGDWAVRAKRTTEISGVFLFLGDQHPGYLVWLSTAGGDHQRAVFGATADALAQGLICVQDDSIDVAPTNETAMIQQPHTCSQVQPSREAPRTATAAATAHPPRTSTVVTATGANSPAQPSSRGTAKQLATAQKAAASQAASREQLSGRCQGLTSRLQPVQPAQRGLLDRQPQLGSQLGKPSTPSRLAQPDRSVASTRSKGLTAGRLQPACLQLHHGSQRAADSRSLAASQRVQPAAPAGSLPKPAATGIIAATSRFQLPGAAQPALHTPRVRQEPQQTSTRPTGYTDRHKPTTPTNTQATVIATIKAAAPAATARLVSTRKAVAAPTSCVDAVTKALYAHSDVSTSAESRAPYGNTGESTKRPGVTHTQPAGAMQPRTDQAAAVPWREDIASTTQPAGLDTRAAAVPWREDKAAETQQDLYSIASTTQQDYSIPTATDSTLDTAVAMATLTIRTKPQGKSVSNKDPKSTPGAHLDTDEGLAFLAWDATAESFSQGSEFSDVSAAKKAAGDKAWAHDEADGDDSCGDSLYEGVDKPRATSGLLTKAASKGVKKLCSGLARGVKSCLGQ